MEYSSRKIFYRRVPPGGTSGRLVTPKKKKAVLRWSGPFQNSDFYIQKNNNKILPQRCSRQLGGHVLGGRQSGLALVPADSMHYADYADRLGGFRIFN